MAALDRRWRAVLTVLLAIYVMTRDGAIADAVHLMGVVIHLVAIVGGWLLLRQKSQHELAEPLRD